VLTGTSHEDLRKLETKSR